MKRVKGAAAAVFSEREFSHWKISETIDGFVQIDKCICLNSTMYLSEFQNVFLEFQKRWFSQWKISETIDPRP